MRTLACLMLLLCTAAAHAQVSLLSPFLGTWENANRRTREIVKLEISDAGGQPRIHLWFSASPAPYDAGIFDIALHTETGPTGGRRNGTLLRLQTTLTSQTLEILVEPAADDRLEVTLIRLAGTNRGTFERMTFRKYTPSSDCLNYNPDNVTIQGTRIMEGRNILMDFSDPRDRELGATLARAYASYCTIGRDNTRPNRNAYIFEYWTGGRNGASAPTFDCSPYDPSRLRVTNLGAEGYRVESVTGSGTMYLQLFNTLADANAGLAVFRRYSFQCFIGRGSREVFQYLK